MWTHTSAYGVMEVFEGLNASVSAMTLVLSQPLFPVFSSVSRHQATEQTVLSLFHLCSGFNTSVLTIALHDSPL